MSLLTTFLALFTFNLQGQPESDLSPTPDNVRKIGCGANDPNVKRACPCLLRTEQADGSPAVSWLSFNAEHKKGCKAGDDVFTCWGTTWAALGLPHTLLVASAPPSEKVVFEENFTDALGKDWSWYREVRDHFQYLHGDGGRNARFHLAWRLLESLTQQPLQRRPCMVDRSHLFAYHSPLAVVTTDISTETKAVQPTMAPPYWADPDSVDPSLFLRASMSIPFFYDLFKRGWRLPWISSASSVGTNIGGFAKN